MKKFLKAGALISIPCNRKVWCQHEKKDIFEPVTRVYGMILKDYTNYSSHTADVRAGLFEVLLIPEFKIFGNNSSAPVEPFFWADLFMTTNSKLNSHRKFKPLFKDAINRSWDDLNRKVFARVLLLGKFLEVE
jgi:hypothetical protein